MVGPPLGPNREGCLLGRPCRRWPLRRPCRLGSDATGGSSAGPAGAPGMRPRGHRGKGGEGDPGPA
eukprot:8107117-Pyramimonas_sp.AAC.1